MEAANRGAAQGKGKSVGLNIELAFGAEGQPLRQCADALPLFLFAQGLLRQIQHRLRLHAGRALGTLDEFFEVLTLVQPRRIPRVPLILFGRDYWTGLAALGQSDGGKGEVHQPRRPGVGDGDGRPAKDDPNHCRLHAAGRPAGDRAENGGLSAGLPPTFHFPDVPSHAAGERYYGGHGEMRNMARISLGIWVGVGGRCEGAAVSGISHFIEHLLFKGTRRRSARGYFPGGGRPWWYLNAFTSEEQTRFYARARDDHFEESLEVWRIRSFHF